VLGLFSIGGMYDSTRLLVSKHNDAIKWGNRLFEHYRQQATKFIL
jgi:predicted transcriptional regulator